MSSLKCLSGFQLKIIAIILMTIDHVGAIFFPQTIGFRIIGRIAFPIFAFLCVEGMIHTKNAEKYLMRMLIFALISEVPYDLAFRGTVLEFNNQNIFLTLAIGMICIHILQDANMPSWKYSLVFIVSLAAELLNTDYGMIGVWIIVGLYITRDCWWKMVLILFITNVLLFGSVQCYAALAVIPIFMYNGERGLKIKHFFYVYYPLHLFVLFLIDMLIL